MPTLFVIAGPNGCGKSTLTRTTWFDGIDLIDPDEVAYNNLPAAILESDEVHFYDNTDPDHPHREVGIIRQGVWSTTIHTYEWVMKAYIGVKNLAANPDMRPK